LGEESIASSSCWEVVFSFALSFLHLHGAFLRVCGAGFSGFCFVFVLMERRESITTIIEYFPYLSGMDLVFSFSFSLGLIYISSGVFASF